MELIVSDFMSSTCVVNQQPNISKVYALLYAVVNNNKPYVNYDYSRIAMSSGSSAELYIDPMLSCISDVDIMCHDNYVLAIPAGYPCPPSLPTEFHREVQVYELENTKYPCYVLLRLAYRLTTRASGTFRVVDKLESIGIRFHLPHWLPSGGLHGPAEVHGDLFALRNRFRVSDSKSSSCSVDSVYCVRCLVWSPQATEWTTRRRGHGWPDSATVDCIVNNGCDVVQVAHPWCRDDGCMSKFQWRLSFSRAETVLLNSWSPKQQLVYHVLRVVATIIQSKYQNTVIRRYYLKTLMLWACERHSEDWWNARCIVSICTQLLHELADGLRLGKLPMYFVTECNLFDSTRGIRSEQLELVICDLCKLTDENLSMRIFGTYVRQCAQLCGIELLDSRYFDDVSRPTISHMFTHLIIDRRLRNMNITCWENFCQAVTCLEQISFVVQPTAKNCHYVIEQLRTIDYRLTDFFCSSVFLNILKKLERGDSAVDVADLIVTVVRLHGQYTTRSAGTNAPTVNKFLCVKDFIPFVEGTNTGLKFGNTVSPHIRQPACAVGLPSANRSTIALLVVLIYIIHPELCADKTITFESNSLHRLLLHSAVDCLSVFRQIMSRDFSSVGAIVTNDYEAMYAYKCGLYEQCFRLCYQNVKSLLDCPLSPQSRPSVTRFPELYFSYLLDNDCLSLTCAARLCDAFNTSPWTDKESMTQLTLSCYLLLQSKLKLRHSPSTFVDILRVVKFVHDSHEARNIGNRSMLIFIYRKVILYMKSGLSK